VMTGLFIGHPGAFDQIVTTERGKPNGAFTDNIDGNKLTGARVSYTPNRRSFIIASGLTALASTRAFGANDTIRVGVIGAGGRMRNLLDAADESAVPYQIVAVSDVYGPRRDEVKERSKGLATTHLDYHEVLAKDIDAVFIAAPDHWHVRMAVDALAAGKDVYLEKPVTHTIEEGATLTKAVHSGKQILQCGMQQRSWTHFRNAVDLIQGGSLGRVIQVRTYWWQNYSRGSWVPKPIDTQALDWKMWLGGAPDQEFSLEKFYRWRWFWNFGGGAMTDLFTHWIDVVQWAMKSDEPRMAQVLADKYVFEEWDCPDTLQAALRYPGFDVVYEGNMSSSIDDGGIEFRGTEATLKIDRAGFAIFREGLKSAQNPVLTEESFIDGTTTHVANFFECLKTRKQPNAPVETGIAAARAGHIANLAYRHTGQITWPQKA
jgi:predicted dehydrogenase